MIVTYLRSSSLNTLSWCEHKYFCSYVLGIPEISNKAAEIGTIVHKVMEIFTKAKETKQNNQEEFEDDIFGKIKIKECNNINKIVNDVYVAYTTKSIHKWESNDLKSCLKHTKNILAFNNGMFDPRKLNVVKGEQYFDLKIPEQWAKYKFTTPRGTLEGELAIKGTIDLITKIDDNTYEIIDWKTGKYRTDWNTNKLKQYDDFEQDIQLRLYHYATSLLYPKIDNIIITIFYVQAGGPFTIIFHKSDLIKTEEMIREYFEKIKRIAKPKLNITWKCNKFCHYGRNKFEGSENTICQDICNSIQNVGVNSTIDKYGQSLDQIGDYKSGGGRENVK